MKILALMGSYRKNGNSDILAKEALMGAEEARADVAALRLTDYKIEACQGFGLCLFRKEGCHIKDDLKYIWSKIGEADGVILSVPCYSRTPYGFWGSSTHGERIAKALADETGGGW